MRLTQQHLAVAIAALYLSIGVLLQAWVQATATKPEQRGTQPRLSQRAPRGISPFAAWETTSPIAFL
jgi:hypothetical protein